MKARHMQFEGDKGAFAKAFIQAQGNMEAITKDNENGGFKGSKYADLATVVDAIVPALNKAGIAVLQSPAFDGEMVTITTTLLHESGASVTSDLKLRPSKADPQGVGSAITYGRRYSLLAVAGVAPEDDDGNAASGPPQNAKKPAPKVPEPSPAAVDAAKLAIGLCETPEALEGWLTMNGDAIRQYCDSDRAQIRAAVQAHKAGFAKEPAREIFE